MATLRALDHDDLPAVVRLMQSHLLRRELPGGDALGFLTATTLADPWADPEIPSIVAVDDDATIVGFLACQPRRFLLGGRPVRAACISHFVVTPDARRIALAPQILRRVLAGPQEFTFSDSANEVVARLWRAMGGHVDHVRCCDWMLVLQPLHWAAKVVRGRLRDGRVRREVLPVAALPLQIGGSRLVRTAFPRVLPGVTRREATPAELANALASLPSDAQLRPDYDEAFLTALWHNIRRGGWRIICDIVIRDGGAIGAYVYALDSRTARVLAVFARPGESATVLAVLVDDARKRGAGVLTGRLEPQMIEALAGRLAVLGFARQPIVHSRHPAVREALLRGTAVISRLDGEWWVT
jgi:GNAT superfamily N-acetyltransferase